MSLNLNNRLAYTQHTTAHSFTTYKDWASFLRKQWWMIAESSITGIQKVNLYIHILPFFNPMSLSLQSKIHAIEGYELAVLTYSQSMRRCRCSPWTSLLLGFQPVSAQEICQPSMRQTCQRQKFKLILLTPKRVSLFVYQPQIFRSDRSSCPVWTSINQ